MVPGEGFHGGKDLGGRREIIPFFDLTLTPLNLVLRDREPMASDVRCGPVDPADLAVRLKESDDLGGDDSGVSVHDDCLRTRGKTIHKILNKLEKEGDDPPRA